MQGITLDLIGEARQIITGQQYAVASGTKMLLYISGVRAKALRAFEVGQVAYFKPHLALMG